MDRCGLVTAVNLSVINSCHGNKVQWWSVLSYLTNYTFIFYETDTHLMVSFPGQPGKAAPERLDQSGF